MSINDLLALDNVVQKIKIHPVVNGYEKFLVSIGLVYFVAATFLF